MPNLLSNVSRFFPSGLIQHSSTLHESSPKEKIVSECPKSIAAFLISFERLFPAYVSPAITRNYGFVLFRQLRHHNDKLLWLVSYLTHLLGCHRWCWIFQALYSYFYQDFLLWQSAIDRILTFCLLIEVALLWFRFPLSWKSRIDWTQDLMIFFFSPSWVYLSILHVLLSLCQAYS